MPVYRSYLTLQIRRKFISHNKTRVSIDHSRVYIKEINVFKLDGWACSEVAIFFQRTRSKNYSAASRTSGAAARTSASTCFSYLVKFSWNMRTSLRAVSSKALLSFQVFIG